MHKIVASLLGAALLAGCQNLSMRSHTAFAQLAPTQGSTARGTANFIEEGDAVVVEARVSGLTPGLHGFHVHEKGNCTAPDASSAGPHFDPHGSKHGSAESMPRHAGDLGNLSAGADGVALYRARIEGISLGIGEDSIIGRALIVHEKPDDLTGQPSGNAGARLACGLISKSKDKWF